MTNSILWDLSRFVLVNKVEANEKEGEKVSAYIKKGEKGSEKEIGREWGESGRTEEGER